MYAREVICEICKERFILRMENEEYQQDVTRPLCPQCRNSVKIQADKLREEKEREIRRQKEETDRREFVRRLQDWNVVPVEDVRPRNLNTLYVIGNGFDLMHRVPSSYYHFRDSLGKSSKLRRALEDYITVDNLWGDFENALAHFDISAMTDEYLLDTLLDSFGAYDEDSSAAQYYLSIEWAATPIRTVVNDLPRRFRMWVETLTVGTDDRPLNNIFVNGKVLDFNYTEFVESIYGVSKENICYIHGCRVKQKGQPRQPLILGHLLGASDEAFDNIGNSENKLRGSKRAFVEMAQENVVDYISECDESLTKDTSKIIENNAPFFAGLSAVETVIFIGHSLSQTDWDYFEKVRSSIDNVQDVKWYFGCYCLKDLLNLDNLLSALAIDRSDVTIFRTDTVSATQLPALHKKGAPKEAKIKPLCKSDDGKWSVERLDDVLLVNNAADGTVDYRVRIPYGFKRAFFVADDNRILIVTYNYSPGVLLLSKVGEHWQFTGELVCDHQNLLVDRLKSVFATNDDITFVYNNRVRKYSLADGALIYNKAVHNAKNKRYAGKNIVHMFSRYDI